MDTGAFTADYASFQDMDESGVQLIGTPAGILDQ